MKRMKAGMLALAVLGVAAVVGPPSQALAATALTVTARHAVLGDAPGAVVLVGRYTCGPFPSGVPDRGVIDLGIQQVVNGVRVTAIGYLEPTVCTGRPQRYTVVLTAYSGSFVRGAGSWSASGYVEGPTGLQNVYVPPTPIRIRAAGR